VRAVISYCFITIPSMEDVFGRLNLYLLAGEVALMNQALPQADSLFKAAVMLLQDVPPKIEPDIKSTEEMLISYINNFSSILIIVPGHPEQGPFYLMKGLLKTISSYSWEKGSVAKLRIYCNMLVVFATCYQPKFPISIKGIEANDALYGGEPDYQNELQTIINKVLDDILEELAKLKAEDTENKDTAKHSKIALDIFNVTLAFAELTTKSATLAVKLFEIAKQGADGVYLSNSLNYVKTKEGNLAKELLKKLVL